MVEKNNCKFIGLCDSEKCSGCSACFNVCPTNSILMQENQYAEIHPIVNYDTCLNCGLCRKVCPQISGINFKECSKCYAGWRSDENKRKNSSSGGIAALIYEKFFKLGYTCYGVKYDFKTGALFLPVKSIKDIDQMKGSKYVQANVGKIFSDIGNKLENNEKIVFIGSPCQIAGIENFINVKYKKFRENIILIDFLCHGTVPGKYLLDEIHEIECNKKTHVNGISFRSNISKRNYYFSLYHNYHLFYSKKAELQPYFYGFLNSTFCRDSCIDCPYKYEKRVGDVTLGDFIGLGYSIPITIPQGINPSLILINSKQGEKVIKEIQNESVLIERNFEEALLGGPSFHRKNVNNNKREKFRELYITSGYNNARNKVISKKMVIEYYTSKFYMLKRRIKKKMFKILRGKS